MNTAATIAHERTMVLCHGVFDVLHLGHIRHLQEARKFGDYLVVSVTADKWVNKGMGRPHFTAEQRAEALRALDCVDEVVVNDDEGAWDLIRRIRPSVYVKGIDYVGSDTPGLLLEQAAIAEVGGQIRFTGTTKWSSSALLNAEKFSPEVCRYLDGLKRAGAKERILEAFEAADQKQIMFVGEIILDVYRYVRGLGRASKELMLATVETDNEAFEGGVLASVRHGEWKKANYLSHPRSTGISKTRFVDADFNKKLFDVYSASEIEMTSGQRRDFREKLQDAVSSSDVVIVNDFGHGLMANIEREIVRDAKFLALNCQTNAGNYGFNLVTRYARADYICIDDPEARLAAGMQRESILSVAEKITQQVNCHDLLITHGRFGSFGYNVRQNRIERHEHPALAQGGVDTMGAGDAVLAVTAPLVAVGLPLSIAALVGNVVGAIKVSILGHRRHVSRSEIVKTVEALLA